MTNFKDKAWFSTSSGCIELEIQRGHAAGDISDHDITEEA